MSIKALTGLVPEWFTPEGEGEATDPATFEIMALTPPQIAKIQQHFDGETGAINGEGLYKAAVMGIRNWRGVEDHKGEALKFNKRNIDTLPYTLLLELGGQIIANSFLSEEDEKNS